jgi:hypothetical protein
MVVKFDQRGGGTRLLHYACSVVRRSQKSERIAFEHGFLPREISNNDLAGSASSVPPMLRNNAKLGSRTTGEFQ